MGPDRVAAMLARGPSLERRALHEEVAERLRELITEGRLEPGARLNERLLCEGLGVSRTPLREAFKSLAAERLIELTPNRGARVIVLSEASIRELFELMGALEGLSGQLAAERRTPADRRRIRRLHEQMLDAHASGELPAYYRLNREIHEAINRCARNAELTETYRAVNTRIQNLRFRSNFNQSKWDQAVREHERMLAFLDAGDSIALRAELERHLGHKCDAVLEGLRSAAAGAGR
ncbi:MAG: GntR family transcriptional regulator [Burkholderiaceae bacterium]